MLLPFGQQFENWGPLSLSGKRVGYPHTVIKSHCKLIFFRTYELFPARGDGFIDAARTTRTAEG